MKFASDMDWLRQVQSDPTITSPAFEVAFVIMQHVNAKSGRAWPTQETLANAIRVSTRTVRTLLDQLVTQGHLTVQITGGRNNPNVYRLKTQKTVKRRKPTSTLNAPIGGSQLPPKDAEKVEAGFHVNDPLGGNSEQFRWKNPAIKVEAHFLQNSPQELTSVIPVGDADASADSKSTNVVPSQDAELYRRGKDILGPSAGGMIRRLVKAKGGSTALARAALEQASEKADPREYIGAIVNGRNRDGPELSAYDRGYSW